MLTIRPLCRPPSVTGTAPARRAHCSAAAVRCTAVRVWNFTAEAAATHMRGGASSLRLCARKKKRKTPAGTTAGRRRQKRRIADPGDQGGQHSAARGKGEGERVGVGGQTKRHPVSWNSTPLKSGAAWKQRTDAKGEKNTKQKGKKMAIGHRSYVCVCVRLSGDATGCS